MDPKRLSFIERIIGFSIRQKWLVIILTGFALMAAVKAMHQVPLDAIPDLSDTQVIVYSRWDQSPDIIEDQVTYPIVTSLLGAPGVKAIRGFSDFGFSYVYVIFKDGTDIYWARSRVAEYLSKIQASLPQGVKTELGPDATGVGWVFQYALVDKTGTHSLQELRSVQDWYMKYHLQSVEGVSEVASIGGHVKQYQITIDPIKLKAFNLSITDVAQVLKESNADTGGRLIEFSGAEYMVRARGYIKGIADIENIAIKSTGQGTSVLIKDIATVAIGPDIRRGIADLDGIGDAVGGTIVMRFGENALNVIQRVKDRLEELKHSLPQGINIEVTYDRSQLITRAIDSLRSQLIEEMIIVSVVILLFLWHFPSAILAIITIPVAVILTFLPMLGMKLTSNIMSLAGIAISVGVLVDGAIVQMENVYKRLEEWEQGGRKEDKKDVVEGALKEVGSSIFFALLVIAVSFLPIFTLLDQEGRLFTPLAWSKTFVMAIAALLVLTLDPALRMLFLRVKPFRSRLANSLFIGTYRPESQHPVSRVLFSVYEPVCRAALKKPLVTLATAILIFCASIPVFFKLGNEFMPPLWEGDLLFMPTTMPGISVAEAAKLMQTQDKIIKSFPEVDKVWGKAGRMESSTDPAPLSMMETVILLKPESQWPTKISHQELIAKLDHALQIPGTTNAWTMPIKNRIDMLSTGIRTPVGIKILGPDLQTIESIALKLEGIMQRVPKTRSVFAERAAGGYFCDIDLKRDQLATFGLTVAQAQMIISSAIGGENVTTTIEGVERYGVSVRYPRELRSTSTDLERVYVTTPAGQQIQLSDIAEIKVRLGPAMIRNENGMRAGYVYIDVDTDDIGGYVKKAKALVSQELVLPQGYAIAFSGQYENMVRVQERMMIIIPLTLVLITLLLYVNTGSMVKTAIVLLAVPFSLIGAVWLLYALGYNMSIAVWVGMIALMGLDAETGVLMLLYLDLAYKKAKDSNQLNNRVELTEAIVHGAVRRVRPKMMTVVTAFCGLLPIMWATGAGSDVMRHIAAPMIGGLVTSFALELIVYPVVYYLWKERVEFKTALKS